ncbi:MAG: hypoxanthine-guanine phosphoribosyltransferase, partial [Betaproteobacteria bacterium HGW-Betaproteobacteria-17]
MTLLQAQQLLDNAECVASADTVQAVINRMAGEIAGELAAELPLVLAVMGGAVVFAGQLLP